MENKFKPTLTLEIKSSLDFFEKLLQEYNDFDKQHLNPRFAMNAAINSWHLSDWTFHEFFTEDERFQDSITINKNGSQLLISGLLKYQQYLIKLCPELEYMRLISNGTKHCILKNSSIKEKTTIHEGDFSSDFSRHDFNVNRFVIEVDRNNKLDFEKVLLSTIEFWKSHLNNLRTQLEN